MFNRSRAWAAGLLIAAFGAGVAVGAATAAFGDRNEGRAPERGPRLSYIERLERDLALRPTQRDSVAGILERHNSTTREISRQARESFDTMRLQVRSEIMHVLDEGQQDLFRTINARHDSLRAERGRRNERD